MACHHGRSPSAAELAAQIRREIASLPPPPPHVWVLDCEDEAGEQFDLTAYGEASAELLAEQAREHGCQVKAIRREPNQFRI